ncbi:MAG TPA: aminotransferase class III-fold pyridoxal phosphate-dependent enzyme, partial [Microlunatus sp.]|nr:aminotransferase class III-fold pyridoxal phosphate-dependent enzyme [Microlunatus sp.]
PDVAELRGRGAMMALELVRSDTGEPDPERTQEVLSAVHRQGVILLTCGTDGNVIRLLPPLSIPDDLLREGLRVLRDAVVTG